MLIKEFRLTLPLSVEEFQLGQLYSISQASKNETGGGEGVEVVKNETFSNFPLLGGKYSSGQYTYKIYHLESRVPSFIRLVAPKGSLEIHEESWNAYPYCRTVITNPGYMKERFLIVIESLHMPNKGDEENVHELSEEKLKLRTVVKVDIANDPVPSADYKESEDPSKFKSVKSGRGPLNGNWIEKANPVMTCYKLVSVDFKWSGLQSWTESFILKQERRIFHQFHRQIFCWMDFWYGLTMEEVRAIEEQTRIELDKQRMLGEIRGTKPEAS